MCMYVCMCVCVCVCEEGGRIEIIVNLDKELSILRSEL